MAGPNTPPTEDHKKNAATHGASLTASQQQQATKKKNDITTDTSTTTSMKAFSSSVELPSAEPLVFALNGKKVELAIGTWDVSWSLNDYLRSRPTLRGTKIACGEGGCGACAVVISCWEGGGGSATASNSNNNNDTRKEVCLAINSCLRPLASLHGWNVTTVEGLRQQGKGKNSKTTPHPIQARLSRYNASQCGYCTPGMVSSLYAQLHKSQGSCSGKQDIAQALDGNICRCTGYRPILDAAASFSAADGCSSSSIDNKDKKAGLAAVADVEDVTDQLHCLSLVATGTNQKDKAEEEEGPYEVATYDETPLVLLADDTHDHQSSSLAGYVLEGKGGNRWYQPQSLSQLWRVLSWHPEATLLAGNTGRSGVYKAEKEMKEAEEAMTAEAVPANYISLQDLKELQGFTYTATTGWLDVGAGLTLSDLIALLEGGLPEGAFPSASFKEALLAHLRRIAGTLVRNAGSLGGNLHMAKTKNFDSDLSTLLGGLGAVVKVVCSGVAEGAGPGQQRQEEEKEKEKEMSWLDYLHHKEALPFGESRAEEQEEVVPVVQRQLLTRIRIPLRLQPVGTSGGAATSIDVFQSYRSALRKGNSHAFANAAFRAVLDTSTGTLTHVTLCVGALGMPAVRAKDTESILLSSGGLDQATLEAALLALRKEVVPASKTRYRYRLELLSSYLYKFFLHLVSQGGASGGGCPSRLLSAATVPKLPLALEESEQKYSERWMLGEGEEGEEGEGGKKSNGNGDKEKNTHTHTTTKTNLAHAPLRQDYQGYQASGEAVYVSDIPEVEGTLYAAYVKSPRSVGILGALDTEAAKALPGVITILTAADIPGANDSAFYFGPPDTVPDTVFVPLGGRVAFHSQPLALVVATSQEIAQRAAKLVSVVFDGFEAPIITIADARDAHSSMGIKDGVKRGDAAAVLRKIRESESETDGGHSSTTTTTTSSSPLKLIHGALRSGSQKHFYLEPQTAYAIPDEGRMLIYSSNQAPQAVQEIVARVLNTHMNTVQVKMRRAGGAFGGKATRNLPHAAAAAVAAKVVGKPVRLTLDRATDMQLTGGRHAMEAEYEVAFDAQTGVLEAVVVEVWLNGGFCADLSFTPCHDLASNLECAYYVPHFEASIEVLRTNLPTSTTMRGPGVVQASFIMETILEHVAAEMAGVVSPEEVRRVNFFRRQDKEKEKEEETMMKSAGCQHMPSLPISHFTLPEIWGQLTESARLVARREEVAAFNAAHRWRKRGVAMTPVKFMSPLMPMQATVNAYPDGSLLIHHGGCEIGQGIHAKSALVALQALQALGVEAPPTLGMVLFGDTDTDVIPNGGYTAASTTSERACAAVDKACREMVERLVPLRDRLLVEKKEKMEKEQATTSGNGGGDGNGGAGNGGSVNLTWKELIKTALSFRESLDLCCHVQWKPAVSYYHNYGAALSEVEVDVLTGETQLRACHLLYDCGKSINPAADLGQVEGAFVQGLGFYLMEEALIASDGALQSPGTWEYKPPLLADLPAEWKVELLENGGFDKGFLSSKASGEPPLVLATSVMMAVRRAVGAARVEMGGGGNSFVRLDAPATPERIHRACGGSMGRMSLTDDDASSPSCNKPWLDETPRKVQVAVAGAGLGGLAVAIALDKLGVDAALFERAAALRDVSQGLVGITPNGLRALELIDPRLKEYLLERGKYNTEAFTKTVDEQGQVSERIVSFEAHNVSIPWADIQHSLARLVPKAMINCSHDFAGFDEDEDGVTIYFKGRVETVRADVLVGVDGLFSVVRRGLVPFPEGDGDEVCQSGHTNWNAIMHPGNAGLPYPHPVVSLTYQKEEPPRFFFMIECGHGRILWQVRVDDPKKEYTVAPKRGHGRLGLAGVKQRILDLVADVPDVLPYIAATPEETIFERCLLFRKSLQRYSTPGRRVVLVGDAAHAMHSVRGQGANMTFEDAHCLGLALAAKGVTPAAVRVFERARVPRANMVQWESNTYYKRQFERNTSHTWALKFLNFQSYVKDFAKHETLPEELLK